jgi:hypothetical protein
MVAQREMDLLFQGTINLSNIDRRKAGAGTSKFAYIPRDLSWTVDGNQLQFVPKDPENGRTRLWLMPLDKADQTKVVTLTSQAEFLNDCCQYIQDVSDIDPRGNAFLWDRHSILKRV